MIDEDHGDKRCKTCDAFSQIIAPNGEIQSVGQCRAGPPELVNHEVVGKLHSQWPTVDASDWCRAYVPL
jgi:hypothetical protein